MWHESSFVNAMNLVRKFATITQIKNFSYGIIIFGVPCISNGFQDICIEIYLGYDLELSESSDVIDHMTILYPMCHFL